MFVYMPPIDWPPATSLAGIRTCAPRRRARGSSNREQALRDLEIEQRIEEQLLLDHALLERVRERLQLLMLRYW